MGEKVVEHKETQKELLSAQRNELSEYHIYKWLAKRIRNDKNREVLERIAKDELNHHNIFKRITQREVHPRKFRIFFYKFISLLLGLSFGLRLMERGEEVTQRVYSRLKEELPKLADVMMDEQKHENEILGLIKDERIEYAGSIVLGLNDALVELTGALAGLTFALQNTRIIAVAGFITGVAASMSMAASELLSAREEADETTSRSPFKAAVYTGIAYIITVMVLISPYLFIPDVYVALAVTMTLSILVILSYSFYITTAKGIGLWRRFGEMAGISLAVAFVSFLVGLVIRMLFGVDI